MQIDKSFRVDINYEEAKATIRQQDLTVSHSLTNPERYPDSIDLAIIHKYIEARCWERYGMTMTDLLDGMRQLMEPAND